LRQRRLATGRQTGQQDECRDQTPCRQGLHSVSPRAATARQPSGIGL
jgi:hypothetical protein